MVTYKFRAECLADVVHFLDFLHNFKVTIERKDDFPDVEVTLETILYLDTIKSLMSAIIDSHVMLETVALASDYTGIRTYE